MIVTHLDKKKLLEAILEVFLNKTDLLEVVFFELGISLDEITRGESYKHDVFNLIEWAISKGKLEELIKAVFGNHPGFVERFFPEISDMLRTQNRDLDETIAKEFKLQEEIKSYLPDFTEEQVRRFAEQLERLEKIKHFFKENPENLNRFEDFLARATKALDYKRPYRIAVIGTTGAGKSTLINALLGRELVLMRDIGKPATGTALEIFLDVGEGKQETALVEYRNEANIRHLIQEFVDRYQLDGADLLDNLDISLVRTISNWKSTLELNERERKEFNDLRITIANLVEQYINNQNQDYQNMKLQTEFSLASAKDVEKLMELIDENSNLNQKNSPFRLIGLVKSVTYHIKPQKNDKQLQTLQLPSNVCLVDLPGLDGSPLHDIIISEGIKEADAVILILRPPRILSRSDYYLLNRVRKYISIEGSVQSGERIFLVLNAKDSIMLDYVPDFLSQDMFNLMDLLVPGYTKHFKNRGGDQPYFLTSNCLPKTPTPVKPASFSIAIASPSTRPPLQKNAFPFSLPSPFPSRPHLS